MSRLLCSRGYRSHAWHVATAIPSRHTGQACIASTTGLHRAEQRAAAAVHQSRPVEPLLLRHCSNHTPGLARPTFRPPPQFAQLSSRQAVHQLQGPGDRAASSRGGAPAASSSNTYGRRRQAGAQGAGAGGRVSRAASPRAAAWLEVTEGLRSLRSRPRSRPWGGTGCAVAAPPPLPPPFDCPQRSSPCLPAAMAPGCAPLPLPCLSPSSILVSARREHLPSAAGDAAASRRAPYVCCPCLPGCPPGPPAAPIPALLHAAPTWPSAAQPTGR